MWMKSQMMRTKSQFDKIELFYPNEDVKSWSPGNHLSDFVFQSNHLSVQASKESRKRKIIEEFLSPGRKAHPLGGLHPGKPHPGPAIISEKIGAVPCEPVERAEVQFQCGIRTVFNTKGDACNEVRFVLTWVMDRFMDINAHWHVHDPSMFIPYGLLLVHVEHIGDGRDRERFHFKNQEKTSIHMAALMPCTDVMRTVEGNEWRASRQTCRRINFR